ncbi:Crp/Fnr family transcriptional regulator [Candidatus Venteria ishoeyi]|uniref:Crp/Fnr family transcriptional regulator n=1 Tax=Candidatus Venteria ishoeyi TaxID=1899563 RepID=A0A1H6FH43_9GAMM|nr:Crp/Fnr family transcriptional regulator [Candidatus Venteria ishoeyi]SEH08355.1 Uncharacterised protein [Candidatus Venteria ishoeyi]
MTNLKKRLLKYWDKLPQTERETLLAFAEFLHARADIPDPKTLKQVLIARPEQESVIAAIKRLSASYPMLEKSKMLNETAALMSQHMIQGREAKEVIDELEIIFEQHYQAFLQPA